MHTYISLVQISCLNPFPLLSALIWGPNTVTISLLFLNIGAEKMNTFTNTVTIHSNAFYPKKRDGKMYSIIISEI